MGMDALMNEFVVEFGINLWLWFPLRHYKHGTKNRFAYNSKFGDVMNKGTIASQLNW